MDPQRGHGAWLLQGRGSQRAWGWPPAEEPGDPRRSLSFLTEDATDGSICAALPEAGSLLQEPGGCSGLRGPLPSLSIPSFAPWPQGDPGGSAVLPHPLASSTLLSDGDELREGPWSRAVVGGSGAPPQVLPQLRTRVPPSPCPPRVFGPGGSPRQPQRCSRVLRTHGAAPEAPGPGGSSGDSSSDSECFVSALETLGPRCCCSSTGLELGEGPSGAGAMELPPPSIPPAPERAEGGGFRGAPRAPPCCEDASDTGDVGELLTQLQGCSLQGSPPSTPGALPRLSAGDAGPQEPPMYQHVTPRTRSRLLASAERFGASSSSSVLSDTLEMPRRPPRVRAPRAVPRDPATASGRCVTQQDTDVCSGDREETGSLGDTVLLPGAPSSSPGSSPTVPLLPGDPQCPPSDAQGSSGSSPTVLLLPGDPQCPPSDAQGSPGSSPTVALVPADPQCPPSDAQGSSGSSPTVLLVPGDPQCPPSDAQGSPGSSPTVPLLPGDPQCPPSDAQGSSGSSPTVLLVPGYPQCPPSDARGSPCATLRALEGGSGCQDPSPLGAPQPQWLHRRFCHLLAPRALPVPPSTQEHPECEEQERAPPERHGPGPEDTAPLRPLSDEGLRRRLRALGDDPGPITGLTRQLYLRRLEELLRTARSSPAGHSPELAAALQSGLIPDCAQDELVLRQEFDRPDRSRHWREGLVKSSFNYLLLDPRTTQNLPLRSHQLSPAECFRTFIQAIFYVGKGTRTRPYCHLTEALGQHHAGTQKGGPKVRRILEIWASGHGVLSVHCFQSTVPAEAYTREGCMVEALGLQSITNQRKGLCYGTVAHWPAARRRRLGVQMLHRAMSIFLAEGERQLRPVDIQGGR
ncbi:ankyrin repeat and LEM domain-containing protein 1 isoform X2 [Neopsephotus bourkii]|uniref:ankyrin repeat and LEM domain-containing protein 1 isoform X2 n=1 Tax=Neopsephotus bourkii TaxID=309878 RepID=UPI002AA56E63|nr:ankyrin repeat and LEM domain-containing protein 1 isoform X2 [Neopsephotus bourkii]